MRGWHVATTPRRRLVLADLAVAAWVALWIAVAVVVALEVRDLRGLGETVVVGADAVDASARALDRTGAALATTRDGLRETGEGLVQVRAALDALGDLPFVGDVATGELDDVLRSLEDALGRLDGLEEDVARLATEARETAASARSSGRESAESATLLAVLLGLAIALIPTGTVLAVYVPARLRRRL